MSVSRLIVLKFGGSVLQDSGTLQKAVHEIHRWRRKDYRVLAVVSALAGKTDELLRSCHNSECEPDAYAVAELLAGGERHSASLLNLLLGRAGIPARVMTPERFAFSASGQPLDANPCTLEAAPILEVLQRDEVVIVPGFIAQDHQGRGVLLGRGGSDLSAIFLAQQLLATRCRLIKDVPALYAWDPKADGALPPRYAAVTWQTAMDTDGSVLQRKAVAYAQDRNFRFEVGGFNETHPTLVGAPTTIELDGKTRRTHQEKPLRVALLGFGTVGIGVHSLLQGLPELFVVTQVLVRDRGLIRGIDIDPDLLCDAEELDLSQADVVVEAIGGKQAAKVWIEQGLRSGAHVVTANKAVMAAHGEDLAQIAEACNVKLLRSAAVGGCAPILERLLEGGLRPVAIRSILNGTVNFVLDGLAHGRAWTDLLRTAYERGFAEEDPSLDLSGLDACDKLTLLSAACGEVLQAETIEPEALDGSALLRIAQAKDQGRVLKQVATLDLTPGNPRARVALQELQPDDPLAQTFGEDNAFEGSYSDGSTRLVRGKGAGRWPTAESVVGDLLRLQREPYGSQEDRTGSRIAQTKGR